jgi:spermidine synthase
VYKPAILLLGFTAVIAQIVLMRELLVVFSGNEVSLGFALAGWLLWTAFGSSVLGRIAGPPARQVALLEVALAVTLPLTVLAVRASRGWWHVLPGELLGPGAMLATALGALSVVCALAGWLFAASSRLCGGTTAAATGRVYLLEAVGSAVGGILASLLLIRYLGSVEIVLLVSVLNLAGAALLVRGAGAATAVSMLLLAVPYGARLDDLSLVRMWPGFRLAGTARSVYGDLAVVEAGGARSVYENGVVLFHGEDAAAAEENVHYALLEHPSPRSLLLIGGGMSGSLREALKHASLARVEYAEMDPAVLGLAPKFFTGPPARVRTHTVDGRLLLKTTPERFDVIIVNLPDPQTAQWNRFYTAEFFREAAAKLTGAGLVSFHLTASENYISPELAALLRCVYKTLGAVFADVAAMPGDQVHFFAANRQGLLTRDPRVLAERLRARGLGTEYVREHFLKYRMSADRMAELDRQITPRPDTKVNRDFEPVAYYYGAAWWGERFRGGYGAAVAAMLAAGVLLLFALLTRAARGKRRIAGAATAATGFTMLGVEMMLLLGFQALYGSVYQQLAVVVALFMAGAALGSWAAARERGSTPMRRLMLLQLGTAVAAPLVCGIMPVLPAVGFPALALLVGALGGYQFVIATKVFFADEQEDRRGAGLLYGLDLAGACLGALLFGAYLIPLAGFFKTALGAAALNLVPAIAAARASRRTPGR